MKTPAFQFYPDHWLGSQNIMSMSPAQEGGYVRLLCWAWNSEDCGIPTNVQRLLRLSRLSDEKELDLVLENFYKKNGRFYNKRLLKEREKQEERRKKASEAGKASAKARQLNSNTGSTDVQHTSGEKGVGNREIESRESLKGKSCEEVILYLNDKLGTNYRPNGKETVRMINARLKSGHSIQDFKTVIDKKVAQWKDDAKMAGFLRPKTLFAASNFESYLNQLTGGKNSDRPKTNRQIQKEREYPSDIDPRSLIVNPTKAG